MTSYLTNLPQAQANTPDTALFRTALEDALAAPGGQHLSQSIAARLSELELALRHELSSGVIPKDFAQYQALFDAIVAAQQVLEKLPANPQAALDSVAK